MRAANFIESFLLEVSFFFKESILSEDYALRPGFLQAIDCRLRVLGILVILLAVLFSRSLYFIFFIYLICLFLTSASKVELGFFLKRSWFFVPLFSFFVSLPAIFNIFTPGSPLVGFRVFGFYLAITRQGLKGASFFFFRVLTSVSLCALLMLTTRQNSLLKVLRLFRVPQIFVMILGMCYRYVYLFLELLQNTYLAIKGRVGFICSLDKKQAVVGSIIANLWQRSYHLNEQLYQAMLSRGYRGEPVVWDDFKIRPVDWMWLFFCLVISCSVFYWNAKID